MTSPRSTPNFKRDFDFLGITLRDWPEDMVGRFAGCRLIICAGASCVWDDIARLGIAKEREKWHFMAVNDILMHLPMRVRHAYSNDHRMLPKWLAARRPQYQRKHEDINFVHTNRAEGIKGIISWPWPGHGTSLLGATYTGLAMGYDPIVICGGPLDNSPSYFSPSWERRNFEREVPDREHRGMAFWQAARNKCFRNRVRSMSGRTRDLLGGPD